MGHVQPSYNDRRYNFSAGNCEPFPRRSFSSSNGVKDGDINRIVFHGLISQGPSFHAVFPAFVNGWSRHGRLRLPLHFDQNSISCKILLDAPAAYSVTYKTLFEGVKVLQRMVWQGHMDARCGRWDPGFSPRPASLPHHIECSCCSVNASDLDKVQRQHARNTQSRYRPGRALSEVKRAILFFGR